MKAKLPWKLLAGAAGLGLSLTSLAASDAELEQLKKQVQALEEKVQRLESERALDQDNAAAAAQAAPRIVIGENGFSVSSADSNFVAQLHGLVQLDTHTFFDDGGNNGNDGFLLRRARPIMTGTVFRDFDYNFTPEFAGSSVQIVDAYVNYRYRPEWQVRAGKFKLPVGLELLQSDQNTAFNERSLATDLVPNRDLGLALRGDLFRGVASYVLGVFNDAMDSTATTPNTPVQDDMAFAGRLFFQPWRNAGANPLHGFGFGVGGSYQDNHPNTNAATGLTSGYLTDGLQKFFTYSSGTHADGTGWRVAPQAYYYYGPFGLLAEYVISGQRISKAGNSTDVANTAWGITGSWMLTGEDATYASVNPRHPFDPRNGQWGAWQLAARYNVLDVDDHAFSAGGGNFFASSANSARTANSWSVGLNWYLNKNLRANLSYSWTTFSGFTGAAGPGVVPAQPESALFSRIQLAF